MGVVYNFGPFQLDSRTRRLTREGNVIAVADRHLDVLLQLVTHAGTVVTKDALIADAWRDVAVTDNSLEQAISALRRAEDGLCAPLRCALRSGVYAPGIGPLPIPYELQNIDLGAH